MIRIVGKYRAVPAAFSLMLMLSTSLAFFPSHCLSMLFGTMGSDGHSSEIATSDHNSHASKTPQVLAASSQGQDHSEHAGHGTHRPEDSVTEFPAANTAECCNTESQPDSCDRCEVVSIDCCDTGIAVGLATAVNNSDRSVPALNAALIGPRFDDLLKPTFRLPDSDAAFVWNSPHLSSRSVLGVFLI